MRARSRALCFPVFAAAVLCLAAARCLAQSGAGARTLARAGEIQSEVAAIRELAFKQPVRTELQSRDAFRAYVREAVARQFGERGPRDYVAALVRIGALEEAVDLTEMALRMLESQAAAHYDPRRDVYCLLMTNSSAHFLDVVSSHELCHALQDQHHDLEQFLEGDLEAVRDNGDRAVARQSLVEGEATLVMSIWMIMRKMGLEEPAAAGALASAGVALQASLPFERLISMVQSGLAGADTGSPGMEAALREIDSYPRFFIEQLYSVYTHGALMVDRTRARGGWDAVTALFREPPQSTEQVLHPEKLSGPREQPVDVRLPGLEAALPRGWRVVETDVMGELGIRMLLDMWQPAEARDHAAAVDAAAGWGGDRYCLARAPDAERAVLVWQTLWDTDADARAFAVAYRAALPERFPGLKAAGRCAAGGKVPYQVWQVGPNRFLKLAFKDRLVGVVDADGRDLLAVRWP